MKMPCELIVTHILPTARGALAKELVHNHGMTQVQVANLFGVTSAAVQVQVANLFGVTSAAVSQYIKGLRGGNNLIDKSAYREDFYKMIADTADVVASGKDLTEALCEICTFVKTSGLLKALYVASDKRAHAHCFFISYSYADMLS